MTIDNEAYSRHMAECERQARAEDSVTDEAIGEYVEAELLDEMSIEIMVAKSRGSAKRFARWCEKHAPDTYAKARQALIERAMEVTR